MSTERDIIMLDSLDANLDVASIPYWKLYLINLRHSLAALAKTAVIVAFCVVLPAILFKFTPEPYFGKIMDVYVGVILGTPLLMAVGFVVVLPSLLLVYVPLTALVSRKQSGCRFYMLLAFTVLALTGVLCGFLFRSIQVSILLVLFFVIIGPVIGWQHYKIMYAHFEKYPPK